MYDVARIVHYLDDVTAELRRGHVDNACRAARSAGAVRTLVSPTLPGTINGGDVIVRLRFPDRDSWERGKPAVESALAQSDVVERVHGAEYETGTAGSRPDDRGAGVYRALLLRVAPDTPAATVERFERDLLRMPAYLPSMRSWQLSRVDAAAGACAWTHVWEQEFTDLDALTGPYMDHPIHWSVVDRWFDPECADVIIRDRVCHTYCVLDQPMIG